MGKGMWGVGQSSSDEEWRDNNEAEAKWLETEARF